MSNFTSLSIIYIQKLLITWHVLSCLLSLETADREGQGQRKKSNKTAGMTGATAHVDSSLCEAEPRAQAR